jgi:hypothetical protein
VKGLTPVAIVTLPVFRACAAAPESSPLSRLDASQVYARRRVEPGPHLDWRETEMCRLITTNKLRRRPRATPVGSLRALVL